MILAVQTTTFGAYGGIPTYNRLVCRVLNEMSKAEKSRVLITTDSSSDIESAHLEFPKLALQAFNRNRLALVRRLMSLALTQRFDIALIGHVNYAPLAWILKRFQPQLRYGVMLYGIEAWQPLSGLRQRAVRNADFLISISEYTKQRAIEANSLDADRIHILPNAPDWIEPQTSTLTVQSSAIARTRLLSVCRLEQAEQYKGVDSVIDVLPEVAKRVPDIEYFVVGGGTDLERHRALAETLGVGERVHFPGFLSDDVLRECYRDCDVFVLPSAGEGFGFVFLEAMQFGKPVIAADSGGAPEVVKDGVTGRLVDYGNRQQLADTIIDLCLNPAERQRLGQAGYKRLQENFTFAHFEQKLTAILNKELPVTRIHKFADSDESASCAS